MDMRKLIAALTALLAVGALALPALADHEPDSIVAHSAAANQASFWGEDCAVTGGGQDAPFVVPAPPDGFIWSLLVVKQGSGGDANYVFNDPVVGHGYAGQNGGWSHVVLCKTPTSTTTTSSTSTSVATTTSTVETTTSIAPTSTTVTEVASTVLVTTTDPATAVTLPFTGPEDVALLALSAVALITLGWLVLREAS